MLPCGILGSKFLTCSSKAFPDGHLLPVLPFRCQILALWLKLRDQILYQIADILEHLRFFLNRNEPSVQFVKLGVQRRKLRLQSSGIEQLIRQILSHETVCLIPFVKFGLMLFGELLLAGFPVNLQILIVDGIELRFSFSSFSSLSTVLMRLFTVFICSLVGRPAALSSSSLLSRSATLRMLFSRI